MDYAPPEKYEHLRTDTAYVISGGEAEFDIVASFLSAGDADIYQTLFEVEYGLAPGVMFELEIPIIKNDPEFGGASTGVGDIEFESKFRLAEWGRIATALSVSLEAPTGDVGVGLGSGRWGGGVSLLAGAKFHRVGVHTTLGAEWNADDGFDAILADSTIDYQPPDSSVSYQLSVSIESDAHGRDWRATLTPGLKFKSNIGFFDDASFALGAPIGLTELSDNWGIRFSFGTEL